MEWEMLYGPGRQPGWNVKCQKSRALPLPPLPDAGVLHRAGRDRRKEGGSRAHHTAARQGYAGAVFKHGFQRGRQMADDRRDQRGGFGGR